MVTGKICFLPDLYEHALRGIPWIARSRSVKYNSMVLYLARNLLFIVYISVHEINQRCITFDIQGKGNTISKEYGMNIQEKIKISLT
jgi:hypothetical protein